MQSNDLSQSSKELEKDQTLTPASAAAADAVVNETDAAAQAESTVENPAPAADAEPAAARSHNPFAAMTKDEVVAALEAILEKPIQDVRDEVSQAKAAFYALRNDELYHEREAWVAAGNQVEAFTPAADEAEAKVRDILGQLKDKRAQYNAELDAMRAANLEKKRSIIAEIESIINDPDNVNRQYNRIQQLQQDFKAVGEVPATNETELWKTYQADVEKFYDLLKMNKELRDYDFKKNLAAKQQLCAEAEALDEEADIVVAFKKLQDLHNQWREIGPVAKEIREDLWARFKNASAVINKKYQAFFLERKEKEKANAEAKTALCEQLEAIDTTGFKTYAAWDEATKAIIALQGEWKKLGFASRKVNTDLFARFRKTCDEFFAKKAEFFKGMKDELSENLAKKTALCEKAEALKDSTEWKKTADLLVELQKEWKTIGAVPKRQSDAVWKRFIAACDSFFEAKKKNFTSTRSVEHENLKAKKDLIAQAKAVLEADDKTDAPAKVRELMAQWQQVGHVPFREKDKVYNEWKAVIDQAFDQLDMKGTRARMDRFENNINQMGGGDKVMHERDRLVRVFEAKVQEVKTFENNMGFLTSRSKSGNALVQEMQRKIERLKADIAELEQKIKLIDSKI